MLTHLGKKIDLSGNIKYGSTEKEEFAHFTYDVKKKYPIRVESIGITYPDKDYFIERQHGDYYILEYVIDGKGYIQCDDQEYCVEADDIYIIHPGMRHKYGADKKDPYKKIWINFFGRIFTDILAAYGLSNYVIFKNTNCKEHFEKLIELAKNYSDNDEIYLQASEIIFQIILTLVKNTTQDKASRVANLVKETLDRSIYAKVTIESIADEINISKSQICREFKKYFDVTPYQYLITRRIIIAENLLLKTNLSIKEISDLLCFIDAYSFSNAFKKKVGKSPKSYRNNIENQN